MANPIDSAGNTLLVLLYHVAHNDDQRNAVVPPSSRSNGARIRAPVMMLDLHYLIAAETVQASLGEALLERACLRLHETPVISGPDLRPLNLLKFSPVVRQPEELIVSWQGLGRAFRPSLAYCVTVSLDASDGMRPAAPVLERGPG